MENKFKVRLVPVSALRFGADVDSIRSKEVAFRATPTLSESRSVEYSTSSPVHMPGSIQVYKRSSSRTFEISAPLISRNGRDALRNMRYLQLLRSWTLPYFGQTDTTGSSDAQQRVSNDVQLRGAPPDVLYLYAYADQAASVYQGGFNPVNLSRVPVVVTSLGISYPDDVDYIPTSALIDGSSNQIDTTTAVPFPIKLNVTISLLETHSPSEYERFDLTKYKTGTLQGF